MNVTDLRRLFTERADAADIDRSADLRLVGTLGKSRSIRRRRRAVAATFAVAGATVIVALASAVVPALVSSDGEAPPASTPPSPTILMAPDPDPDNALLASAELALPDRVHYLTARPSGPLWMEVRTSCAGFEDQPQLELSVNSTVIATGACGTTASGDHAYWNSLGVMPGAPATIRLAVTSEHDTGTVAVGVYEIGSYEPAQAAVELTSDPEDPNAPRELRLDFHVLIDDISLHLEPEGSTGLMQVQVNGVEVRRSNLSGYEGGDVVLLGHQYQRATGRPLPRGEVEVRLVPERMTGGWRAYAMDCVVTGDGGMNCPVPQRP